jgi:hypothetical protein
MERAPYAQRRGGSRAPAVAPIRSNVKNWMHWLGWGVVAAALAFSSGGVVAVAAAHEGHAACEGACQGNCDGACQGQCQGGCQASKGRCEQAAKSQCGADAGSSDAQANAVPDAATSAPSCETVPSKAKTQPRAIPLPKAATEGAEGEPIAIPLNTRGYNYDDSAPAGGPPSSPPAPAPKQP